MNYYYIVISNRKTKENMVILAVNSANSCIDILQNYADWAGVECKDLLYTILPIVNYDTIVKEQMKYNVS